MFWIYLKYMQLKLCRQSIYLRYWTFSSWYWCLFVLQVFPLWWINWLVHLWLLPVLLLCTIRHVWFHANFVLLRLHGLHLLWLLSHARCCRFPCLAALCPPHIQVHQVWVVVVKPVGKFLLFLLGVKKRSKICFWGHKVGSIVYLVTREALTTTLN